MKKQLLTLLLVVMSLLSSATAWGQVCKIGATSFTTLEEALAYVNSYPDTEMTIIMLTDYTLPAGTYTLPAKATLVVPMSDEQETCIPIKELYISHNAAAPQNVWVKPTKFRSLTFADSVNMNVYGTIELSGKLHASSDDYTSSPYGPYGLLHMSEKAKMVLMNGAELRAWGFMTGKGETDARRGAKVREVFQIGDWKGGTISKELLDSKEGIFPITQYYIQNIESPVKYHPGALLSTMAAVSASASSASVTATADVAIVGVADKDVAMFLMDDKADAENTWVRKWYDASEDQQVYEVNSGAHIGSIVIDLGDMIGMDLEMNSNIYVLPITNNMKIHLLSGYMDFTQSTSLLPGAEVEIDKKSVVSITKDVEHPEVKSGSLYIYDADQWDRYAYAKDGYKYTKVVRYTPSALSANGQPTKRNADVCPDDAAINVHGTFDTNDGYVFTSTSYGIDGGGNIIEIGGGANIFSTNADAGTFILRAEPIKKDTAYQLDYKGKPVPHCFVAAKLRNEDNTFESTADKWVKAEEGNDQMDYSLCYMNSTWKNLVKYDCFAIDMSHGVVYIKPQEYIAVRCSINTETNTITTANPDHTFSDQATGNRRFILMYDNCQWWEVEKVDGDENLFHCIHPLNDNTYYYWDEVNKEWAEKRCTITWLNWDGTPIKDAYGNEINYTVPYGTMAEFLGTNPTKPMDDGYTYTFTGWTPALDTVTANTTYTAVYKSTPRKYTVTLKSDVEGACSFTGAGVYDYNTTATISATMNLGYQFVGWEHDGTLRDMSFTTTVTGDVTYTVRAEALPTLTLLRGGLTPGKMGTYTTAYDVNTYTGAEFYVPNQYTAGGIEFVSVDKLVAGTPYLFVATDNELWGLNEGTAVVADYVYKRGMVGYLGAGQVNVPDGSVVVIQNHLYYAKNNYMTAGYAYFDMNTIQALTPVQESADAPRRKLNIGFKNNAPTGMENIQGDEIQSTKVLIDGTLYILRNGNMYDVTGKLVK
ncbi:MAG: hypothetical protein UIB40_06640 [Paludibacteraceae bacterium]|nr:hypothetical protein [Paludibacteraceae bacterium]